MFKNTFSFNGRIRRTEYGISLIISFFGFGLVSTLTNNYTTDNFFLLATVPLTWFILAQGGKRCHDINTSGWMQIIPFYVLWMLFKEGMLGLNVYGQNPKLLQVTNTMQYQDAIYPDNSYDFDPAAIISGDIIGNAIADDFAANDNSYMQDENMMPDNNSQSYDDSSDNSFDSDDNW